MNIAPDTEVIKMTVQEVVQTGGGDYIIEGLNSYTIAPIDTQYVSDAFEGTSPTDKVLANMPSLNDFLTMFYDKYLNANLENYQVTKKSLGKDQSGTYDIYEYDFKPAKYNRMIMLSSGLHSYEVGAMLGLAYFMDNMIEHHHGDVLLTYLYENVRIKVVPVLNPWGYSQSPKKYGNVRGVNINRNFDYNGIWASFPDYSPDPSDPNYNEWNVKGDYPFSEAETRIISDWVENNLGTEFWIDCHTGLGYKNIDIWSQSLSTSPYNSKIILAHNKLEAWTKDYYNISSVVTKYVYDSETSVRTKWVEGKYGIPQVVIEQAPESDNTWKAANNASAEAAVNYTAQIYAYVGEFLLKTSETVDSTEYIETLQQTAIENKKYQTPFPAQTKKLIGISATKTRTAYSAGDTLDTSDISVTAQYNVGTTAAVATNIQIDDSDVDMSTAGTYAIGVKYTEGNLTASTSVNIVVSENNVLTIKQGGISSANGTITENSARVYYFESVSIPSFPCEVSKGNGLDGFYLSGRIYHNDDSYWKGVAFGNNPDWSENIWVPSSASTDGWISAQTFTISASQFDTPPSARIRFVIKKIDGSDFTPSEIDGKTTTFNGVTYTLKAIT